MPDSPSAKTIGAAKDVLSPLLSALDDRSHRTVQLRYGLTTYARTFEEIGEQLGLTREQIRRLLGGLVRQLRQEAKPELLRAVEQDVATIRAALIDEHGVIRIEDIPRPFDLPWTDLALEICEISSRDWASLVLGHKPGPAS